MSKILIDISFVGTEYNGYQIQPNAPTVQGQLNVAAKKLFGFECDIVGCSRTDSGVHANQFCATISDKGSESLNTNIPIEKIASALNFYLPEDISVKSSKSVDDSFHARYDVKSKEYLYRILNTRERNPFLNNRAWHYPKHIDDTSLENMRLAAKMLEGTHDFSSYMAANSSVSTTVRTVYSTDVYRENDTIIFKVSADGFLYNMVRIFTGTLIAVAEGRIAPSEIASITDAKDRTRAGVTAPPQGLYLNKVNY